MVFDRKILLQGFTVKKKVEVFHQGRHKKYQMDVLLFFIL